MIIAFVALGIITYIAALVCAIKKSDWKPRLFLSFYSDLFFLTAGIMAKSKIFIIVFAICCLYSLMKIVSFSKASIQQDKGEKKEHKQ